MNNFRILIVLGRKGKVISKRNTKHSISNIELLPFPFLMDISYCEEVRGVLGGGGVGWFVWRVLGPTAQPLCSSTHCQQKLVTGTLCLLIIIFISSHHVIRVQFQGVHKLGLAFCEF